MRWDAGPTGTSLRRPAGAAGAWVLAAVLLSSCGSATPGAAGSRSPTTTSAPSTTAAPTTSTTAGDGGAAFLTAWGATVAAWAANHQPDPGRAGGWWPRLPDNRDTYQSLDVVGGRVVGYTLALDPSVSSAEAQTRLANDLPLDATKTLDRSLQACEQIVEDSPTLRTATGARVLVELRSTGSAYQPSAVSTIVTSALGPSADPPGTC